MGPNEQNQHFAQLRQKNCLYIDVIVLLTCLPSLDGKLERFVTKSQTRVRQTIIQVCTSTVTELYRSSGW